MSEISDLDRSALDFLRVARAAEHQEIVSRATAIHDLAQQQDGNLTLTGLIGSEAIRLYNTLETRELYYMGSPKLRPTIFDRFSGGRRLGGAIYAARLRRLKSYADYIELQHDGDISAEEAAYWAKQEINRQRSLRNYHEISETLGVEQNIHIDAHGYGYYAPAVPAAEAEDISGISISQQWRVTAGLPTKSNGMHKTISTVHEYVRGRFKRKTLLHSVKLLRDSEPEVTVLPEVSGQALQSELFFLLGMITISHEAVVADLPKQIRKRMVE